MKIKLTSVFVDDQESALNFYTDILGFEKKQDFPVGEFKWLTVVSPEEPDGPELLLEPSDNPAARAYNRKLAYALAGFALLQPNARPVPPRAPVPHQGHKLQGLGIQL